MSTALKSSATEARLRELLQQRILILDGAMGTMIQRYKLTEADYRGDRFSEFRLEHNPSFLLCRMHVVWGPRTRYALKDGFVSGGQ